MEKTHYEIKTKIVAPVFFFNILDRIYYSRTEHTASELDNTLIANSKRDFPVIHSSSSSSSSSSSFSNISTTAHCGLWPVEQYSSIFLICHQLSPSSPSQHLKISFYFLFPYFPGSSPSSRPFQFLSEDLFGHPILLHSLQVT